jgi:predicted transcriptional regulator
MLDQFEVADLPFKDIVILPETETLKKASALMASKASDLLVVTHVEGLIRGVVAAEVVTAIASFAPEGLLSRLAVQRVVEVSAQTRLLDAIRLVSQNGVGALAVRRHTGEMKLLSRESLVDFNGWSLLLKARDRRLASQLPPATLN